MELMPFLQDLISLPGLSGHEKPIRQRIEAAWEPLVDELNVSRLGSLQGLVRGKLPLPEGQPHPCLMLSAHMDAIGLMVTRVRAGFLSVTQIGGVDPRVLPGQPVTIHGREDLPGIIVQPASHLLPEDVRQDAIPLKYLLVETGLYPSEVERLVRPGDLVSFAQPPLPLGDGLLAGHSLDNRASVAAVTACLQALHGRELAWDVWAVATVQEEVTLGGALTSAFHLRPSIGVAIDVTFGASPGTPDHKSYPLGKCITLGWGPNIHPALFRQFKALAGKLEIPFQMEPMPGSSGTDAMGIQIAAAGIPTMVVSIPLRYMHTPVEMVALKDIERAGRLLAEFAANLEPDYAENLSWDEAHD